MNPGHIFAGTHKENMEDCAQKDRTAHGEKSGVHKLTELEVREIKAAWASGRYTQSELARAYGVVPSNISAMVNGKIWARVA